MTHNVLLRTYCAQKTRCLIICYVDQLRRQQCRIEFRAVLIVSARGTDREPPDCVDHEAMIRTPRRQYDAIGDASRENLMATQFVATIQHGQISRYSPQSYSVRCNTSVFITRP
jgi:hypothetical protein